MQSCPEVYSLVFVALQVSSAYGLPRMTLGSGSVLSFPVSGVTGPRGQLSALLEIFTRPKST